MMYSTQFLSFFLFLLPFHLADRQGSKFIRVGSSANLRDSGDILFSRKQATWDDALKGCKGYADAILLSIETPEESELVLGLINSDDLFDPPLPEGTTFWTSGKYALPRREWVWWATSSPKPIRFGPWTSKMWAKGQPSPQGRNELDRVAIERNNLNHSNWKILQANEKAFYICEIPM